MSVSNSGQYSRYVECVNLKKILWEEKTITNVHTHTCIKERESVCVCVCISSLHNKVKAIEYTIAHKKKNNDSPS